MVGTWWFEETKLLIALWSEQAVQQELNTMHNKKLVWDKKAKKWPVEGIQELSHPLLLFHTAYFSSSSFRGFLCLSSGLQIIAAVR